MTITDPGMGPGLDRAPKGPSAAETRRVLPHYAEEAHHVFAPSHHVARRRGCSSDTIPRLPLQIR